MTIIETISRQVPNTKEGKEYLQLWLKSKEGNEYVAVDWYEDHHGITMSETVWLEGCGRGQKMTNENDLIRRADAIEAVCDVVMDEFNTSLPSAEAVQGWRIDKPTESGEYMVTLDAWGHRYIDVIHYAKPQMPNREVDGACWYRYDDEWGDVVYDGEDILAWMPLPTPYKGGDSE